MVEILFLLIAAIVAVHLVTRSWWGGVNFEVYIKHGEEWELHSRYPASKEELALQNAKSLAHISTVSAVKVIRETYDSASGANIEALIYDSSKPSPGVFHPAQRRPSGGGRGRRRDDRQGIHGS